MEPPITLVALDHQPAVIRTTTDTIHLSIGGEVSGLSASMSGPWDLTRTAPLLLGRGVSTGVYGGGEDTGKSDKGGWSSPSVLAGETGISSLSGIGPLNFSL